MMMISFSLDEKKKNPDQEDGRKIRGKGSLQSLPSTEIYSLFFQRE
jgi:hypothetical protein